MRNNRFQNHVSESIYTLPMCILGGAMLWFLMPGTLNFNFDTSHWISLLLCIFITYIIMETNNVNALIRIRTRMVSVVWIVLLSACPLLHEFSFGLIAAACITVSHRLLFRSYQEFQDVNDIFHSFVFLGVACIAVPQLLVLVPLYLWYMLVFLRSLTLRTFCAGLVGLVLPLWLAGGWCAFSGDYAFLLERWQSLTSSFQTPIDLYTEYLSPTNPVTVTFCYLTLIGLICIPHFLHTYYRDKIRTRMLLYIYVLQSIACWIIIVCHPSGYNILLPVLLVCMSPLIAHFFALTGNIVTNLLFCLNLIVISAIALVNYEVIHLEQIIALFER